MAFESPMIFEMGPYIRHPTPGGPVSVAPTIPNMAVSHIPSLPFPPIMDPMAMMKPAVCTVVPNPPASDRISINLPEELYKTMIYDTDVLLDEDMVTTCAHCGQVNYIMDLKWKKAKTKLKHIDEFMNVLKKQITFNFIPSVSAANQAASIPGILCQAPPEMYNLKSNLSANAQEFRPIQNQKTNLHAEENQSVNKDVYGSHVITNDETAKLPVDQNDSGTLESGIDSGVHDSGVSDSGVTDPAITESGTDRYVAGLDVDNGNACNACESDSLKSDKDTKKKTKKKRQKKSQKSEHGSTDNLLSDTANEGEFINQNSNVVYHNKNTSLGGGRPLPNDLKTGSVAGAPHRSNAPTRGYANDADWIRSTQHKDGYRGVTPRDDIEKHNGQFERENHPRSLGSRNPGHRRNDIGACDPPSLGGPGKPRDVRGSSSHRRNNTNTSNYNNVRKYSGGRPFSSVLQEVDGDLFAASADYSLAHCVAEDLRMGAGIAIHFRNKFNNVAELLEQGKTVGEVAVLSPTSTQCPNRYVFYIITKQYSNGKPTLDDMKRAIRSLREECVKYDVKKVAMPRIGCGLDRLKWKDVQNALFDEFFQTDIELKIYNLREDEESAELYPKKSIAPQPKVEYRNHPLVQIEEFTALVVYGTLDGYMDKSCESVNAKHSFKDTYLKMVKRHSLPLGEVIQINVSKSEDVFVLIVRENAAAPFSFKNLESCAKRLNQLLKKLHYEYMAFDFVDDHCDPTFNEKALTIFRNCIHSKVNVYPCNVPNREHTSYTSQNSNNESSKYNQSGRRY